MSDLHVLVLPSFYRTERQPLSGIFVREQALALQAQGCRVGMIYPDIRSAWREPAHLLRALRPSVQHVDEGFPILRLRGASFPKLARVARRLYVSQTLRLYADYRGRYGPPDVVHAHSLIWAGIAAAQLHTRFGTPFVVTEHRGRFLASPQVEARLLAEAADPLVARTLQEASAVITVSRRMQPYLLSLAPDVRPKLVAIPNLVDTARFVPGDRAPHPPFTFIAVGSLTSSKGFDTLLRAFALLPRPTLKHVRLRIVGEGPERAGLERLARGLRLGGHVVFLGQRDPAQVALELQRAHAFVLAPRFEAFGVVFIEALAAGLPVIGTRAGGPEEIIHPGNGLLVEPDQPERLAEALTALCLDPDRYDPQTLHAEALTTYSQAAVGRRIAEVLARAARSRMAR